VNNVTKPTEEYDLRTIPINKIKLGKNSRLDIKHEELSGLMQSIKAEGLLQPIGLVKKGKYYDIVYGNRRFLAMSKLGRKNIPAIVLPETNQLRIDIKNLTENVQRRNITVNEVGRYIDLLMKNGMSKKEVAVRLGVGSQYIDVCLKTFQVVPKDIRDKVVPQMGSTKLKKGEVGMSAIKKIEAARKKHRLLGADRTKLYNMTKEPSFNANYVDKYAAKLKAKSKKTAAQIIKEINEETTLVSMRFTLSAVEYTKVYEKYVQSGPFSSVPAAFIAMLQGKVHIKTHTLKSEARNRKA
jgi:ParB/RepB/Spo0J family partition protein